MLGKHWQVVSLLRASVSLYDNSHSEERHGWVAGCAPLSPEQTDIHFNTEGQKLP